MGNSCSASRDEIVYSNQGVQPMPDKGKDLDEVEDITAIQPEILIEDEQPTIEVQADQDNPGDLADVTELEENSETALNDEPVSAEASSEKIEDPGSQDEKAEQVPTEEVVEPESQDTLAEENPVTDPEIQEESTEDSKLETEVAVEGEVPSEAPGED